MNLWRGPDSNEGRTLGRGTLGREISTGWTLGREISQGWPLGREISPRWPLGREISPGWTLGREISPGWPLGRGTLGREISPGWTLGREISPGWTLGREISPGGTLGREISPGWPLGREISPRWPLGREPLYLTWTTIPFVKMNRKLFAEKPGTEPGIAPTYWFGMSVSYRWGTRKYQTPLCYLWYNLVVWAPGLRNVSRFYKMPESTSLIKVGALIVSD